MPLPEFSPFAPARLVHARPAARDQAFVDVEPCPGFAEAHRTAGQFCQIRVGEAAGIFAMYSAPGEPARFLVRVGNPEGGQAADALAELPDGAPLEMTLPAGAGFDLAGARHKDLYFVATGTGIAPVRAAIEQVLRERESYGQIRLDHGLRSEAHLAIADDLERWRAQGVSVHLCYSHFDAVRGVVGQSVLSSLRDARPDLAHAAVIGVGQSAMLDSLREVIAELGGDPGALLTNL